MAIVDYHVVRDRGAWRVKEEGREIGLFIERDAAIQRAIEAGSWAVELGHYPRVFVEVAESVFHLVWRHESAPLR